MLLINLITDVIHNISIFLLCKLFFKFKLKEKKRYILVSLIVPIFLVMLSIIMYFSDNITGDIFVYFAVVVIILCLIYDEKYSYIFVSTLWIFILLGVIEAMALVLCEMIGKIVQYSDDNILRLCASILSLVFVLILCLLYSKNNNKGIVSIGSKNILAYTILAGIDMVIVLFLAAIARKEEQITNMLMFIVSLILVILGLFLQLGAVILIMVQRNIYKESQQLTEKYLEEQKNHYEYLEKRETETKKFRHDLRSHMEMLSVLAKEHRYDEFDKYVEEINVNIDSFGNNVSVQNGIVDAIINKYYSEAVASDVSMEVKGRFPSDCKIDAYHLCTIFSNILSNALEATIEAKKKWISVECRYTDNNILVEVKNTFDNKNGVRNGKARTHKKDANNHGFGLENVKDSIRKYNGLWQIDIDEDIYTITISFNYVRQE